MRIPGVLLIAAIIGGALPACAADGVPPGLDTLAGRPSLRAFGGHADAIRGAAHYGVIGTAMTLVSVQQLTVSLSSEGGDTATIRPAWVVPGLAGLGPSTVRLSATKAGDAGATVGGLLTAADPASGMITCRGCRFAAQSGTESAISIAGSGAEQNGESALSGADYGAATITDLTDARGVVYGSSITLPDAMLPFVNRTSSLPGVRVCVMTAPGQTWCGKIFDDSANTQGRSFSAAGLASSGHPAAFPGHGTLVAKVFWSPFLFRADDADACAGRGRAIEIPQAGVGVQPVTRVGRNPAERIIQAVNDPFNATLMAPVPSPAGADASGGIDGYVITGCDDWPAYQAAVRALNTAPDRQEVANQIYLPGDSFMASAWSSAGAGNFQPITQILACGEGTIFWPSDNALFIHGAAQCGDERAIHSFPDVKDLIPSVTLRHVAALPPGATATLVTVGNSPFVPGSNEAGFISSRASKLCAWFEAAFPLLRWRCIDRSIGGEQFMHLDPAGATNGHPPNWPYYPRWYSDPTRTWMSYIEADKPDVIVFGFSDQEAQAIAFSAVLTVPAATQTPAWRAATGRNPDIGFMPWPWQPTGNWSQSGTDFAAAMQRSFVKACVDRLAAGGCPFLIDVARAESVLVDGYDPEEIPLRRAAAMPTRDGAAITHFPWSVATPRLAMSALPRFRTLAPASSAGDVFARAGGELDFIIGAAANAAPQSNPLRGTFVTQPATDGSMSLVVGFNAYLMTTGETIAGPGLDGANPIEAISLAGPASAIRLHRPTSGPIVPSDGFTLIAPGPDLGYPGQILRLSKDPGGHVAIRFDTVYTPTVAADCAATPAQPGIVTCATPQVGNWHRGLSLAIPGAGIGQCPNQGGGADCAIGVIRAVSFTGDLRETITLQGAPITAAVHDVQPIIYRTSIPTNVSERAAELLTGGCVIRNYAYLQLQVEYRGSRAVVSYCDTNGPGPSKLFDGRLERWDGPFHFTIDSPTHLAGLALLAEGGPSFAVTAGLAATHAGSAGTWFEADPQYPTARPTLRLSPDIYGWCGGVSFGNQPASPYGGECTAHQGTMGAHMLDDFILSALRGP